MAKLQYTAFLPVQKGGRPEIRAGKQELGGRCSMKLEDRKIELGKSSAKCGCKLGPERQRCICGSREDNEDE